MAQTFAANEPGCFKCHGDKRGPFTFEHAPVRFESCATCHEPHGSANPRMLTRPVVQQVCLECHANLPAAVNRRRPRESCRPRFTICDRRASRTAQCAIRRFTAAMWIGISCDEAAVVHRSLRCRLAAQETAPHGAGRTRPTRSSRRGRAPGGLASSLDRILAHRIDRSWDIAGEPESPAASILIAAS